jgi:predicted RNase H-like HicB family nuclease
MQTVRVIYHREGDAWWGESPDVEGWSVAADSYAAAVRLAEEGVPFALGHEVELEHSAAADSAARI